MTSRWDYETLDNALYSSGCGYVAAFVHGYLVARILMRSPEPDLAQMLAAELPDLNETLRFDWLHLAEQSRQQLLADDFGFQLWLPAEDEAFSHRLHALAQWCTGFVFVSSQHPEFWLSEDAQELLQDLDDISEVEIEAEAEVDQLEDEDREADLYELHEFVRTAVLTLAEESLHQVEH